jgi:hypothetical protein
MLSPGKTFSETSSNNSRPPNDLESPATVSITIPGKENDAAAYCRRPPRLHALQSETLRSKLSMLDSIAGFGSRNKLSVVS